MAALGLVLSSCSVDDAVRGDAVATSEASQPSDSDQTPATESTQDVAPALPEIPVEFEQRSSRVLTVLSDWGYDTNTGEMDNSSVMARYLTPINADSELPTMSLSLEWGQDVPYGDRETVGTVETAGFALNVLHVEGDAAGVWFACDRMIVVLRAEVPMEDLTNFAADIHRDGCSTSAF